MTDPIMATAGAASLAANTPVVAPQPTAQQTARFEAQLQAPLGSNWHSVMNNVKQVGAEVRAQFSEAMEGGGIDTRGLDPQMAKAMKLAEQTMAKATHFSYSMLNFQLVSSAQHIASESVRTLYQQQS